MVGVRPRPRLVRTGFRLRSGENGAARRGQQIGHRCIFVGLLFAALFFVYYLYFPIDWSNLFGRLEISKADSDRSISHFTSAYFRSIVIVQFMAVVLVTPAYTAAAITEEKQRRTLEFLLATDLTNHEIVLGILGSRLSAVVLLLISSMPFFGFLQLLGGVDPNEIVVVFLAQLCLLLAVGSVCINVSVQAKTAMSALMLSYLYVFVGGMFLLMCGGPCFLISSSLTSSTGSPAAGYALAMPVLVAIGVFFILKATASLRQCALEDQVAQALGAPPSWEALPGSVRKTEPSPGTSAGWGPFPTQEEKRRTLYRESLQDYGPRRKVLPPIGNDPFLWKELYSGTAPIVKAWRGVGLLVLMVLSAMVGIPVLAMYMHAQDTDDAHQLVRGLTIFLSSFMFFFMALNSAGAVTREREQQTLDSLLTVPPERSSVLFAKWLASILLFLPFASGLALLWAAATFGQALSPAALPFLVAAWIIYASFASALGLWVSSTQKSTLRATLLTLLIGFLALVGPGCMNRLMRLEPLFSPPSTQALGPTALMLEIGLTPPSTLWVLAFNSKDFGYSEREYTYQHIWAAIAGLHVYGLCAFVLFGASYQRLLAERGPTPKRR